MLLDAVDGTPVSVALRLGTAGRSLADYHGTPRGWTVRRNGEATALPAVLADLGDPFVAVPAGHVAVDADRGRVKVAPGVLDPSDVVTIDFAAHDAVDEQQRFDALARRLPRALPAGVVALVADTRRPPVNPAHLV